ncbi:signal protein [Vitiosangium sp. GDMCC 1.1324]|uniref:signal protein n=1 Tax=Vitiosangium sp. (strain GDMCC 1.1324) TaxID=2138576 RepID=UPI000D39386E|nr:signal protein [Vitiosangium sp. GDMCC 1.1324]PTL78993.1 signal protein [Vitiosangium sp. GDMCC 1.1324]
MSADTQPSTPSHVVRRKYLLDTGFQLRYMLRLAALGGGGVMLVGVLAYRAHRAAVEGGASPEALAVGGETMLWLTGLGALLFAGLMALFGLVLTHRVAGPVHVMSLYIATLAAGRYPRMRPLRKKDELRGFFDRFSEAVDRIRERETEEVRLLSEVIETLQPLATTQETQAALSILGSLRARKRQAIEGPTSGALKSVA